MKTLKFLMVLFVVTLFAMTAAIAQPPIVGELTEPYPEGPSICGDDVVSGTWTIQWKLWSDKAQFIYTWSLNGELGAYEGRAINNSHNHILPNGSANYTEEVTMIVKRNGIPYAQGHQVFHLPATLMGKLRLIYGNLSCIVLTKIESLLFINEVVLKGELFVFNLLKKYFVLNIPQYRLYNNQPSYPRGFLLVW